MVATDSSAGAGFLFAADLCSAGAPDLVDHVVRFPICSAFQPARTGFEPGAGQLPAGADDGDPVSAGGAFDGLELEAARIVRGCDWATAFSACSWGFCPVPFEPAEVMGNWCGALAGGGSCRLSSVIERMI